MSLRRLGTVPLAAVVLPVLALMGAGCYGAQVLRQPVAVDKTEQRVQTMAEQQSLLQQEVVRLREKVEAQEELLRSLRADTQTRLREVLESLETLGARVGDTLERSGSYNPPRTVYSTPPAPETGASTDTTNPAASAGGTAAAPPPVDPATTKEIYDNAYLDLNRGNYSLALLGFQDYLRKSPGSELADNAQYWIGETYYVQRDFQKAIEEFSRVEQDHPRGDKVPAALLKIAYCHIQLENRAAARTSLRDLIRRYPKAEESKQAQAKLSSLE